MELLEQSLADFDSKHDSVDPDFFSKIKNISLETLFKNQLVYYLTQKPELDNLFAERLGTDQVVSKVKSMKQKNQSSSFEFRRSDPYLSMAYKEIAKAFGWTQKLPFVKAKPLTQSNLNKEIANAFHRSQGAVFKSKARLQAEAKTKKAIRDRVIQGHSPYLQRQFSGYLNPDASFKDKYGELIGWENVFAKAREIYRLNQSRNTNWLSATRLFEHN